MPAAMEVVSAAWATGLKPPSSLTVSEWADMYRMVAAPSPEPGPWRTDRTPYLKQVMDCLSPLSPARTIAFEKGSQVGATEAGVNWIGYGVHQYPSSALIVLPSQGVAEEWSKTRLDGMIEATPVLAGKILAQKVRSGGNTVFNKRISGGKGVIKIAWSSSAKKLRSTPAANILADEVDGFEGDVDGEGDPVTLLKRRFTNFPRGKLFMCSTPTGEVVSRIHREFESGDQRYYFVPCPQCGHFQRLVFDGLRWGKALPGETPAEKEGRLGGAAYRCIACSTMIQERYKTQMLSRGRWVATVGRKDLAEKGFADSEVSLLASIFSQMNVSRAVSFHLSALYSPLGWYSWATLAADWEAGQKDISALKVFINQVLGEVWCPKAKVVDWERIKGRRENYPIGTVPSRGLVLVAAVDVQDSPARLEWEAVAYGRGRESWSVDYGVIPGDVADTSAAGPWAKLDEVLNREWPHASGQTMPILAMGIDTGKRPTPVYEYALRHAQPAYGPAGTAVFQPRTVVPLKGNDDPYKLIAAVSKTDAAQKRQGVRIWTVGTHYAKREFYDLLALPLPDACDCSGKLDCLVCGGTGRKGGYPPGYHHFPNYEDWYFQGICSERCIERGGKVEWVRDKAFRNEPLDLHGVYVRAVASLCGVDSPGVESQWKELEARYGVKSVAIQRPTPVAVAPPAQSRQARPQPRGGSWIDNNRRSWFGGRNWFGR